MSALGIIVLIFVAGGAFTVVYAVVRVAWRLRQGDVETVGSDSDMFRRNKPDRTDEIDAG